MRFEVSGEVEAPLERVWAWWTDFGATGESFRMKHGPGSSTRTILASDARGATFEDASLIGTVHRVVTLGEGHTFDEVGSGDQAFECQWRFEPVGEGRTRVVRVMRVRAAKVFGPFARWVSAQDLRYHCREATRELSK